MSEQARKVKNEAIPQWNEGPLLQQRALLRGAAAKLRCSCEVLETLKEVV